MEKKTELKAIKIELFCDQCQEIMVEDKSDDLLYLGSMNWENRNIS